MSGTYYEVSTMNEKGEYNLDYYFSKLCFAILNVEGDKEAMDPDWEDCLKFYASLYDHKKKQKYVYQKGIGEKLMKREGFLQFLKEHSMRQTAIKYGVNEKVIQNLCYRYKLSYMGKKGIVNYYDKVGDDYEAI